MTSLSPGNVGMVLQRSMNVDGDKQQIRLETTAADGTLVIRSLTWRRIGQANPR